MTLPSSMEKVVAPFSAAFTRPTFERFAYLIVAGILTTGSRTVSNLLRVIDAFTFGHASSFHRLFSKRRWRGWVLSRILCNLIVRSFCPCGETILLAGDDTVDGHKGKHVSGKSRHRDAVRSTHTYTAWRYGHKWVVLSILVKLPWSRRRFALPCLVALYRTREVNEKLGIRHKTPPELMRGLLAQLLRWFPDDKFVFTGDQSFGTHNLSAFAYRHQSQLTLLSRFYPDANLYALPRSRVAGKVGRNRVKGEKLPSPERVVQKSKMRQKLRVHWYGGGERRIEVVSATANWYKGGEGLVPIRWVYVHDLTGTHRDEYFFTTDTNLPAKEVVSTYTSRWSLETTFQEMRSHVGLESTRGWSKNTVLRMAPALFGLYSIIVLLYHHLPSRSRWKGILNTKWQGKVDLTFSDMLTSLRRHLWIDLILETLRKQRAFPKLPPSLERTLLYGLAPAT